ncbi:hypothetical protein YC2023_088636 [Brassica napus]
MRQTLKDFLENSQNTLGKSSKDFFARRLSMKSSHEVLRKSSKNTSHEVFEKSSEIFCPKWYKGMMSSGKSSESLLNVARSLPGILLQLTIFDFSREDFSDTLEVFSCNQSNPHRLLSTVRRFRENFQKTSIKVFPDKTSREVFYKKRRSSETWVPPCQITIMTLMRGITLFEKPVAIKVIFQDTLRANDKSDPHIFTSQSDVDTTFIIRKQDEPNLTTQGLRRNQNELKKHVKDIIKIADAQTFLIDAEQTSLKVASPNAVPKTKPNAKSTPETKPKA